MMKRRIFEVIIDPKINKIGTNILVNKIQEYKKGINYPVQTFICDNNVDDIKKTVIDRINYLEKILPYNTVHTHNKNIIIFHRDIEGGSKKELFVNISRYLMGNVINWLDLE
jgi:uncharacterized protein YlaI